ncbi:DinB family protein [Micromonospora sp. WMMD1102]|uniref:DinB family protein n=1 Tax=Micromonospora sp. WMMD1102 TaxID=3016105 RepID=UPI00324290EF
MDIDWTGQLLDQLDWHWQHQLRPRLDGLTDAEYHWEPTGGGWGVRPRDEVDPTSAHGAGRYVVEYAVPAPVPPPVTTIAWRLGHLVVGVFGQRSAAHFGAPPVDYDSFEFAGTADAALHQLDTAYATWRDGVRGLGAAGLARPCGPAEGPYADYPLAALVLHINRETIHHGAEISLLRDLYRARR